MIKANITAIGTIKKGAQIRTDKNNKPYLNFILKVMIPDAKKKEKEVEIFVIDENGKQSDISLYSEKRRVTVTGKCDVRKKGEELVFYLNAQDISVKDVSELDNISGDIYFKGHLKSENICDEKTDKNGNPYITFSAYSSEKVGDNFVSTWVNFMRFPEKDAKPEDLKPFWFQPRANFTAEGTFKLESYNNNLRISSRVSNMNLFVKEQ